jgi:Tfp pilus assembly protein PilO
MKSSDRAILVGIGLVAVLAGFWFLVLSPKRAEVSKLDGEVSAVSQSVTQQEELAAFAETAKGDYASNYQRMVVLGKAAPAGEDTASLFVQIDEIAGRSGMGFQAIRLNDSGGGEAPTPASQTTADPPAEGQIASTGSTDSSGTAAPTAAVPTEATAAALPIGATVGSAGLPVMPYDIELSGDFFQLADFLAGLDRLVTARHGREVVDGRLLTIDGFSLAGDEQKGFRVLNADLSVTTYVTPADQGITAGATPSAPAPTTATPASTTTSTTPAP